MECQSKGRWCWLPHQIFEGQVLFLHTGLFLQLVNFCQAGVQVYFQVLSSVMVLVLAHSRCCQQRSQEKVSQGPRGPDVDKVHGRLHSSVSAIGRTSGTRCQRRTRDPGDRNWAPPSSGRLSSPRADVTWLTIQAPHMGILWTVVVTFL